MLFGHGEKGNIHFNSETSACVVEKQLAEELAVFRLLGTTCVEKTRRNNNVLINFPQGRPVAASVLHQAVTSPADEEIRPDEQDVQMEQQSFSIRTRIMSGLQ